MPVKITIEHHDHIIATVETARPDVAAQLTYDAVECALDEECNCEEEARQDAEDQAIADFLYGLSEDAEDCDCPPGRCFVEEELMEQDPLFDSNEYKNGNNNLTTSESAARATSQVAEILNRGQDLGPECFDRISEVCTRAVEVGVPRDVLYSIAGKISSEWERDYYRGLRLSEVFKIHVDKVILAPQFS